MLSFTHSRKPHVVCFIPGQLQLVGDPSLQRSRAGSPLAYPARTVPLLEFVQVIQVIGIDNFYALTILLCLLKRAGLISKGS